MSLVCPECGNSLDGKPPDICSPLRCDAWVTTRIYDHSQREWVSMDDLNALSDSRDTGEKPDG